MRSNQMRWPRAAVGALFLLPVAGWPDCSMGGVSFQRGEVPAGITVNDGLAGHLNVSCDAPADAFTVSVGRGLAGGTGLRAMQCVGTAEWLPYRLTTQQGGNEWGDAGHGDTYAAGDAITGTGSQVYSVFVGIPFSGVRVDQFEDTVPVGLCNGSGCEGGVRIDQHLYAQVSARVRQECSISTVTAADAGRMDWNAAPVTINALATISVNCAGDSAIRIGLGAGENYSVAIGRRMTNDAGFISYRLLNPQGGDWGDQASVAGSPSRPRR